MKPDLVTSSQGLEKLCQELLAAKLIAFDTEFVSEHTYQPELCLIQVAHPGRVALIDPYQGLDVAPFWKIVAETDAPVIVHAGREEMVFCHRAQGAMPARLFDLQIAAGFLGLEYPIGYSTLVLRVLGAVAEKGETRTDWRRRPLSPSQLTYAANDVVHLIPAYEKIKAQLDAAARTTWLEAEMLEWKAKLLDSLGQERWRRVPGSSGLPRRGLAIVRELWQWRDAEATRRNRPSRQIFRDDLMIELARRRSADPQQIMALRGFERGDFRRAVPELAQAIERALAIADDELPMHQRRESTQHLSMVGQFLSSALACLCRAENVSPALVGTAEDVRELIAWRVSEGRRGEGEIPTLERGWRADLVGHKLDDLLTGKLGMRINDPQSEFPLEFFPLN